VSQILEETSEYAVSTFQTPACDIIRRDKLLEALKEYKIPQKLIRLAKLTLKHLRCGIKIQNNLMEQCGIR
jgi:hypothetical protein